MLSPGWALSKCFVKNKPTWKKTTKKTPNSSFFQNNSASVFSYLNQTTLFILNKMKQVCYHFKEMPHYFLM